MLLGMGATGLGGKGLAALYWVLAMGSGCVDWNCKAWGYGHCWVYGCCCCWNIAPRPLMTGEIKSECRL